MGHGGGGVSHRLSSALARAAPSEARRRRNFHRNGSQLRGKAPLGVLFEDDFLDGFGTWPLAYIPYGGPDFGELLAVAQAVGPGDVDAYYAGWIAAGDRTIASAEAANEAGHRASARELYLRGSAFYGASYHPIYGAPVDPRLVAAFNKERQALDNGLALGDPPVRPQSIPFEGKAMPDSPERSGRRFFSPTAMTQRSPTCSSPRPSQPADAAITLFCSMGPDRARCFTRAPFR